GMPLAGGMGFFAKWYVLQAAIQADVPQTVLAVILVVSSAVSAAYYLAVVGAMFMKPRAEGTAIPSPAPLAQALILATATLLIAFGVYPAPVATFARNATTGNTESAAPAKTPSSRTVPLNTASRSR
ncbi:MAG: hypothetical protein IT353_13425, partial [Gemmatimonadaceae bacterium]|nr:hypothetical protein [Gemmatimonadaceae bacterium]